ncbi:NUDIX hydrolase [Patescibacteria group bacterium]|nr:NUDIX hydrolase [Patescibacteria group bacterium]
MISQHKREGFSPKFEVVSCFLEHDGKILLLQRQLHKPQPGTYGVPAGKVDEGETLEEAIKREISEEIGAEVNELTYFTNMFVKHDNYEFIYHMFSAPFDASNPIQINPDEHLTHLRATPHEALTYDLIPDEDTCIKLFYKIA